MSIIYGLGNPGSRYQATRHNIGYLVIDRLSSRWKVKLNGKASGLVYGRAKIEGMDVILAKPLTYMNLSGEPLGVHGVEARDLVVIYDDLDLPWGTIRVRPHGSSGGHRGLASIIDALGSEAFVRVRCGIGRPLQGVAPREYVLEDFTTEEQARLGEVLERASAAVEACILSGVEKAMNAFNRRDGYISHI